MKRAHPTGSDDCHSHRLAPYRRAPLDEPVDDAGLCALRLAPMNPASFRGIAVPGVRPPAGGFVHATVVAAGSDLVFVSGQTPEDVDGSFPPDFEGQARMAWRNVERTLAAAGCTLDDVAKVNMYIRDRVYRETNRTVRNEVLGDRRPALTVLVTDHWDEEWLIEIEVIAARPVADAGPVS